MMRGGALTVYDPKFAAQQLLRDINTITQLMVSK
ncbi:hypothetical protein HK1_02371 [Tepidibacillus sp. HK-1]|nr:hypothetical protein HK1_02371 [Tepidibacillus sp. HK-1]